MGVAGGLEDTGTSNICRAFLRITRIDTHNPFPHRVNSQDGLLSEKVYVRSPVSLYETCGTESGAAMGFSRSTILRTWAG